MVRMLIFLATLFLCSLNSMADNWDKLPYGTIAGERGLLNADDIRNSHKADIKRLKTDYQLSRVEVVVASDDFWYYSIRSKSGLYGVASQKGEIILPPIYSSCKYCPRMPGNDFSVLAAAVPVQGQNGESAKGNAALYTFQNRSYDSSPTFLVEKEDGFSLCDTRGRVVKNMTGQVIYNSYFLMEGVKQDDIRIAMYNDSIPQLMLSNPEGLPIQVYTTDGREVIMPKPSTHGDTLCVTFDSPFVLKDVTAPSTESASMGSVHVNSDHPGARVWVDGQQKGVVPMTLNLLGEHNIRIEDDIHHYYRGIENLVVSPGEQLVRDFTLAPMPLKTNIFALVQYGLSTRSCGAFVGVCKRWGAYAKFLMWGTQMSEKNDVYILDDPLPPNGMPTLKLKGHYSRSYTAGAMYQFNKYLYTYFGAGYVQYSPGHYTNSNDLWKIYPTQIEGVVLDLGIMGCWKSILLSAGWTPMIAKTASQNGKFYSDWHVGIGIKIHKNKKR